MCSNVLYHFGTPIQIRVDTTIFHKNSTGVLEKYLDKIEITMLVFKLRYHVNIRSGHLLFELLMLCLFLTLRNLNCFCFCSQQNFKPLWSRFQDPNKYFGSFNYYLGRFNLLQVVFTNLVFYWCTSTHQG